MIKIEFDKINNRSIALDENKIIGECDFIQNKDNINIVHTEVNSLYQGQGIARKLVECVINETKNNNKTLIADCSYAKKVLENYYRNFK